MRQGSNIVKVDFQRIRSHAQAGNFFPARLAREAGVSRMTVYQLMKGKTEPLATNLKAICDVIGLPIEEAFVAKRRTAKGEGLKKAA